MNIYIYTNITSIDVIKISRNK